MKKMLTLAVLLTLAGSSNAGIVGWLTAEARDWEFIQATGGIRVGAPLKKEGGIVLPVAYDVSGLSAITCRPTRMNSGLTVRKIDLIQKADWLVLRVVTQAVEQKANVATLRYLDLSGVPPGSYEVYYETAGDSTKRLSRIVVP